MTLVGRESEIATLDRLLDGAREGRSGALLLRGEAGIGKTALLDTVAASADGFQILRATGIESEAELPYATLHQLLRPLEERIEHLADPQARAMRGALGLSDEREADRFLVGAGTLTLLADAAEEQPVLVLLDDAAWFDRESDLALGFAARRLHAEGVVLLFAVRDDPTRPYALPGVPELRVERLAEERARELLRTRYGGDIDAARRDDVVARAAGNPLALLELVRDGAGAGGAEQAFAARVHGLPTGTQELLLLAAADSTTSLAVVGAAARELGLDARALEPAETAGLIHAAHGTIAFRHPLVRSAVYDSAPFGARARVHTALADVLTGEDDADRRAWHHAAAVLGTDDAVAAELERSADRARSRAGHAAASAAFERAAELSSEADARALRLVSAAEAAAMAGDGDRSLALVDRMGAVTDPACATRAALVRATVAMHRSDPRESFEWGMEALDRGRDAAPAAALKAAIVATEACAQAQAWDRLPELRAHVGAIRAGTPDERSALAVARGFTAFAADDFDATFAALTEGLELAADSSEPLTLLHAAWAAAYTGDLLQPALLAARAERLARATGALGDVCAILTTRATWELAPARFAAAESSATEALALSRETGQEGLVAVNLALLAHVDGVRGRESSCRRRAAEAIALGEARGNCHPVSAAQLALAVLELGLGRPEEALARLIAVFDNGHMTYRYTVIDDLVEAAARAGRPDDALEAVAAWRRWTHHSGLVVGDIVLARARALMAPAEDADARFQECLAMHESVPWPFVQARTQLAYGEFLRRARRKIEARAQLRAAHDGFERLGAAPWADRAASRAAGDGGDRAQARRRARSTT